MRQLLVVASENVHKLAELRAMLGASWEVRAATDLGIAVPSVVEDGDTFEANAIKKAEQIAAVTFALTLADDSGLEVDVLGGAPGVRSARYAHERASDAENNAALLNALRALDAPTATARFRCVLCLVDPYASSAAERRVIVSGTCEGSITTEPRGAQGFGYDPLFVVAGAAQTFAELSDAQKRACSHRGNAMAAMRPELERRALARMRAYST